MTEADMVPHQPAEVSVFDGRSKALYERIAELKLDNLDSCRLMADIMAQIKTMENQIVAAFEKHLKRAYDTHKGLCADKAKALECLQDAERLAKEKLGQYYMQVEETGDAPHIDGLTVSDVWTGEVVDADKIPRKFLVPDIDALKEYTRQYKEGTRIPGWKVTRGKSVRQRV